MKTVRIVVDWEWEDPQHLLKQTPNADGIWDNIKFTLDEIYECDYLLVYNKPNNPIKVKCPSGNKWLISTEPPETMFEHHSKSYKYFNKVFIQNSKFQALPNVELSHGALPWFFMKDYTFLKNLRPGAKTLNISMVASNANSLPGHKKRIDFQKFLKNSSLEIGFFGRGYRFIEDKFDALFPYKYSIAIENTSCQYYWTEKITDCFLSWTMPIYYGATDILDYFPEESLILIDIEKPEEALETIDKNTRDKKWEKNINAIEKARELILDKYQLFPFIANKINNSENTHHEKKTFKIPANSENSKSLMTTTLIKTCRKLFK